jgi:peptidoglycan hydrolase-like protein with peptidoglycan-binding domain
MRRVKRRGLAAAAGVGVLSIVTAVVLATVQSGSGTRPAGASQATSRVATAAVERRDLVQHASVDGTLGYGTARDVASPRSGTVTAVPTAGTVITLGQSLFEIDGRPVPLLYGPRPMWRALQTGVDDGPDVTQLELNLIGLGYASASDLKVDAHFDAATVAAIKRWQKALGVTQTGSVTPEDFVFAPGPVRVTTVRTPVGGRTGPGNAVFQATGTQRQVALRLDAAQQSLVKVGDKVAVTLPSGADVPGTVTDVGTVATAESSASGSSTPKIDVTVTLDAGTTTSNLDGAPVTVKITQSTAKDVLVVPVRALLALAEGGYAVEVVEGGRTRLVGVQLSSFADGFVAVQGNLSINERVAVAST